MYQGTLAFPKLRWPIEIKRDTFIPSPDATGYDTTGYRGDVIVFQCPLGIAQPLILVADTGPIISLFDGRHSIDDIVNKYSAAGVNRQIVEHVAKLLDDSLYLETARFIAAERGVRDEFHRLEVRPPALAGLSYPAIASDLRQLVDGYMRDATSITPSNQRTLGLVSPHIDYRRGGSCYGKGFAAINAPNTDLVVLIGTSHQYSNGIFHLTLKDFETPLGRIPNARECTQRIADSYGHVRAFSEELVHRREHSLELQLPFLQASIGNAAILPILVGSFHQFVQAESLPDEFAEYDDFVSSLCEPIARELNSGRRMMFLAGVDMAHMGSYFGDTFKITQETLTQVERRDRAYLDAVLACDKHALFAHIAEDGDLRRICGFPSLYTLLDLFGRLGLRPQARLIDYSQAFSEANQCLVTFASLVFESAER